jgi:hypothetical protein
VWHRIFAALSDDPDFEYGDPRLDHRAGAPACSRRKRGTHNQAIGRSRGGLTSKIHLAVDGLRCPLRLELTPGQAHGASRRTSFC